MTRTSGDTDIRVLVADDHPVVRDGLRALLGSLPGLTVVGEAATGSDAVRMTVTLRPQVVVMDLNMPELDGVSATREIRRVAPGVAVLVLTMFEDDDNLYAALRAGARGYLLKGAPQNEIAEAIAAVAAGGAVFGSKVAARVLGHVSEPSTPGRELFPRLTVREREVLDLVATGMPNSAIASRLTLSGKTIANHLSSIFTKLGLATRAEVIVVARDAGLGRDLG